MENKAVPKRVVCFDALNVLACLSVIAMHCNGAVHVFADTYVWRQSLLVDVLAYWAVPVFIMLSGATLMRYRERYTTKEFLRRRFLKTGIPLVVWTAVFYVYYRAEGTITWTGWRALLNSLINFTIVPVYCFFSPLFLVYLSLPVLSRLSDDRRVLWYMTGLGFASCSVLPFVCSALQLTYWGNFAFPMLGGYLIFAVLGYLLYTTELSLWQRIVLYALGAFGAVVRYFHTAIASVQEGAINKLTWEHQNWPTVLLAAAVFVFVKYACRYPLFQREKFVRLVKWLSGASFGIYLIKEAHGITLIDDTYNASPDSMRAALKILGGLKATGKKYAVLADMLELGDYAERGHYETGAFAAENGTDVLIGVGPLAKHIVEGFKNRENSAWFASNAEAIAYLKDRLHPGDAVLCKGSRGMHMDEIIHALSE